MSIISSLAFASELTIAPITATQTDLIKTAFPTSIKNKQLVINIKDASETIQEFMKIESCLSGYNAIPLNKFAAPGKTYYSFNEPMTMMKSHSKNSCLTVIRIHGFELPTKNTLSFEVVFSAEDSGEVSKRNYKMQKQEDGSWLFK